VPWLLLIIVIMRVAYFNDTEQISNRPIEPQLLSARSWFQNNMSHVMFVVTITLFPLEEKVARERDFDTSFRIQAHALTALNLFY